MPDETARLRELLASCTPELLTVSAEQMTALIRRGAEHQKPRARRFDETKFEDDGELISLLLKNSSLLLDRIEALEAENGKLRQGYRDIQRAAEEGRVCDDVAWYDSITTLYDFCAIMLDRQSPALRDLYKDARDLLKGTGE